LTGLKPVTSTSSGGNREEERLSDVALVEATGSLFRRGVPDLNFARNGSFCADSSDGAALFEITSDLLIETFSGCSCIGNYPIIQTAQSRALHSPESIRGSLSIFN
jgi:hypothetical protein